ncbi:MAG: type II secretion system protein GspG [Planctomycetota bacterium]
MMTNITATILGSLTILFTFAGAEVQGRGEAAETKPQQKAEKLFSGPQAGEKTTGFRAADVNGNRKDREFDPVAEAAGGKAIYFFFSTDVDRISARAITNIGLLCSEAKTHGVKSYFIGLAADALAGDQRLRDVWKSVDPGIAASISVDGPEGPGAWGINKKSKVTAVLANENKVTYNYASLSPADSDYELLRTEVSKLAGKPMVVKFSNFTGGRGANDGGMGGGMKREGGEGGRGDSARQEKAQSAPARSTTLDTVALETQQIFDAIQKYIKLNSGKLPADLEVLITKDSNGVSYLPWTELKKDPWNRAYIYEPHATEAKFLLGTYGADGAKGGTGENVDIFKHYPAGRSR